MQRIGQDTRSIERISCFYITLTNSHALLQFSARNIAIVLGVGNYK